MWHILQFKNNNLVVGLSYEAIDATDATDAADAGAIDVQGLLRVSHGATTNLASGTHRIYIMSFDLSGCVYEREDSVETVVSEVVMDFIKVMDRFHRDTYEVDGYADIAAGKESEFESFVHSRRALYADVKHFLLSNLNSITSFVLASIKR